VDSELHIASDHSGISPQTIEVRKAGKEHPASTGGNWSPSPHKLRTERYVDPQNAIDVGAKFQRYKLNLPKPSTGSFM